MSIIATEGLAGGEQDEIPLSHGQRALWFLNRFTTGSSAYILAGALRLRGSLDALALRRAFEVVVDRHPALRTGFREGRGTGSEPTQWVLAHRSPTFVEEDAADWDEARIEAWQAELAW